MEKKFLKYVSEHQILFFVSNISILVKSRCDLNLDPFFIRNYLLESRRIHFDYYADLVDPVLAMQTSF